MSQQGDKFPELKSRKKLQILPGSMKKYSPHTYLPHYFQDSPYYYYIKVFYIKMFDTMLKNTYIAPLTRIETLLQVQHVKMNISPEQRYKGLWDCLKRIPKEQGALSFWRGNLTHNIAVVPFALATLCLRKPFSDAIVNAKKDQPMMLIFQNMLSSGLLGVTQLFFVYPIFFVKTRLQADIGSLNNREFKGISDCVRKIYKAEGIQSFYRGLTVSLGGISIYFAIYFGIYESGTQLMLNNSIKPDRLFQFWFASIVTFSARALAYPFLTMRRRINVQQGTSQKLFNSGFQCFKWTMKNEGLRGFYRGFLPHLMISYYPSVLMLLISTQEVILRGSGKE